MLRFRGVRIVIKVCTLSGRGVRTGRGGADSGSVGYKEPFRLAEDAFPALEEADESQFPYLHIHVPPSSKVLGSNL